MRKVILMAGLALAVAGCAAAPTQPNQAFQTKFLNLASITDQIANQTNVVVNNEIAIPVQVAPITQINALGYGNQTAAPDLTTQIPQTMNIDVGQLMHQFGASL